MAWEDYLQFTGDLRDVTDASAHAMTLLMERAPDSGQFEYVATASPMVLSPYANYAQDVAAGYAMSSQRSKGLSPVRVKQKPITVTAGMLAPIVKWAFTDIAIPYAVDQVAPRLIQGTTRIITNIGREAVGEQFGKTGREVTWRRVPKADACAFCVMMSQWIYTNVTDAAQTVTREGYWRTRKGGERRFYKFKSPGAAYGSKSPAGSKFHGFCRCEPMADFGDRLNVPKSVSDQWDANEVAWDAAYQEATVERFNDLQDLWDRIMSGPGTQESKQRAYKSESGKLPNIEQRALKKLRSEHSIR